MKRVARFLLILCLLAFTPARAAPLPPLILFASLSRGDVRSGDTLEVFLSAYSTSVAPLSLELDATAPIGMTLLSTAWSTDTIRLDRPISILLRYKITLPNDGQYYTLSHTVKDGAGHLAARWVRVRVGTYAWPAAQPPPVRRVFVSYVRKP